jgi:hypothetical protein
MPRHQDIRRRFRAIVGPLAASMIVAAVIAVDASAKTLPLNLTWNGGHELSEEQPVRFLSETPFSLALKKAKINCPNKDDDAGHGFLAFEKTDNQPTDLFSVVPTLEDECAATGWLPDGVKVQLVETEPTQDTLLTLKSNGAAEIRGLHAESPNAVEISSGPTQLCRYTYAKLKGKLKARPSGLFGKELEMAFTKQKLALDRGAVHDSGCGATATLTLSFSQAITSGTNYEIYEEGLK